MPDTHPKTFPLQRLIFLFWGLYFSLVVASNLADGLKALEILPSGWAFASGNFGMIVKVVEIYSVPVWGAGILFAVVILWEIVIAAQFWTLFRKPAELRTPGSPKVVRAFGTGITLWLGFILCDEFFIAYDKFGGLEGAHVAMLSAQILTFLLVYVLNKQSGT